MAELASQFLQDLRYAWRSFRTSPGFALTAVLTIGLGVGVNAGLFSVVNAVAFRDLPATAPGELVAVNQDVQGVPRGQNNDAQFSTIEYEAYRDRSETLSGILAYGRMWVAFLGRENPRPIVATPVSCNYFDVLQRPPAIGGGFSPRHCESAGEAAVAVITHDFWISDYGGDASILGRTVTVNGNDFRIVGVAPEGFAGIDIDRPSLFVPLEAQALLRPDRDYLGTESIAWLNLIGRRADGIADEQVESELAVIAQQLDLEQPGRSTAVWVSRATSMSAPDMRAGVLGTSAVVMAAFGLVLLVACSNVANLMLARADGRTREIAIRLSLGATRRRLVRQFITESLIIAVAGGVLGAVLAVWAFQLLVATGLAALPQGVGALLRIEPEPDTGVFGFAVLISILAGVGFGLAPALSATRPELRMSIEQDTPGAGRRTRSRLQGALVGAQVAFSMVLVVATALLLRGLYQAQSIDPEFDHENLVVAAVDLRSFGYETEQAAAFQRQAIESIRSLPGIEDVAQVLITPLEQRRRRYSYRLPDQGESMIMDNNDVSANYFAVTGIPIVRGRAFTEAETTAPRRSVAIVTESTARSLWPGREPVGETLILDGFEAETLEVVGIARDIEVTTIGETDTRYVYLPAIPLTQPELQLVIRTALPVESLRGGLTDVFARLDPLLPTNIRPLDENFATWASLSGLAASLAFGLGVLALVLASIGVFGVMSTVVGRRVREIGIRLALGAGRADVLRLMLQKSMRPVVIGAAIGVLACFAVARLLSFLLFGVGALDPLALAGAAAAVLGAGFVASVIPARRAMSVDPMTTLRYE